MKELTGTEKQVAWAEKIREFVKNEVSEAMTKVNFTENNLIKLAKIKQDMEIEEAKYWIETFGFKCVNYESSRELFDYLNNNGIAGRKIANKINEKYNKD